VRWLAGAMCLSPPRPKFRDESLCAANVARVLEIGGPSAVFSSGGLRPVYACAARVDNINFTARTAWESELHDSGAFGLHPVRPPGTQWLCDAVVLTEFTHASYDLVPPSHCLDHAANPLAALPNFSGDPDTSASKEFRARPPANATHPCIYHHVFDLALMQAALAATGWSLLAVQAARPCHLVASARRPPP
jgi:hypothetical protein